MVAGALGEAGRGRVGLLDGVFGGLAGGDARHLRRPGTEEDAATTRLRLVLLRDGGESSDAARPGVEERRPTRCRPRAGGAACCDVLTAEGGCALERLASLVAVPDFASVYLALPHGLDPMAVPAVTEMKERIAP